MSIMDVLKEVIAMKVFNINASQEHSALLIELAAKMKDAEIALLGIIALEERKTSDSFPAQEGAIARLRLVYLLNALKVLIMMNSLENQSQTANFARWEESALKLQRIKVQLVKRVTTALLAPIPDSGLVLQVLLVAIDLA